jgi:3',5'-cyclic-nucleotide phosphodiesterase
MEVRVVGCHGGETPRHRTSAFVIDGRLALDAGSLTSQTELRDQWRLEACLVSHGHLDHIRDLATIADNRAQHGCPPLVVAGTAKTIAVLKKHLFNGLLWPDFSAIPDAVTPTIRYQVLRPEVPATVAGYEVQAVMVSHTVPCSGFVIRGGHGSIAYSGDTGPTDRLWEVLNETPDLRGMLMEVSFPNERQALATLSGHHTPRTLAMDLRKLRRAKDLPFILYHIKPVFEREVLRECARIKQFSLTIPDLGDRFVL